MLYRRPDYFDEFTCTADQCQDTCCAGWQIMIDDDSIEKYKKIKGDYIWKVMACVDWEEGCFRQDTAKRCAFLNPDNLCDLYKNAGKDALCKTCRDYPRHTEEYEEVREVTLSVSCPEVARILMERMTPVTFIQEERPEEEETLEFDDFDPFLYSIIEESEDAMLEILQNRRLPLQERAVLVLAMAHDMQRRINHRDMFACTQVIEKYKKPKAQEYVREYIQKKFRCTPQESEYRKVDVSVEEQLSRDMFPLLYELEILREEWKELLHKSQNLLFYSMQESFAALKIEFDLWQKENPEIEIHLEQILVYFLYTYYPGSVYDGKLFAKVQMAVYCTWMIQLLWMARWIRNGRKLESAEMTEILYRFSREIEHSHENLEKLDKMMGKKWLL